LYGCETYPLTLWEEHRLRVFQNRVLRREFESKREKVAGDWTRLHNQELHNLHASSSIIRVIKSRSMMWAEYVACMGEMSNAYNILVAKPEKQSSLGRSRRRWRMLHWALDK
jgi:hypothetical protein